jgi:hypothetical protein
LGHFFICLLLFEAVLAGYLLFLITVWFFVLIFGIKELRRFYFFLNLNFNILIKKEFLVPMHSFTTSSYFIHICQLYLASSLTSI